MMDTLLDAKRVIRYLQKKNLTLSGPHFWLAGREIETSTKGKEVENPEVDPNLVGGRSLADGNPVPIPQREKEKGLS